MIIFDLCCSNEHRFEGWFRSADDFADQLQRKFIHCPQCDSAEVRRVPSAVAIGKSEGTNERPQAQALEPGSAAIMPAGSRAMVLYRELVRTILESSENVGDSFADEARRIHYAEAPERAIRGQASADECEALRDEGIEIFQLPVIKDDELN